MEQVEWQRLVTEHGVTGEADPSDERQGSAQKSGSGASGCIATVMARAKVSAMAMIYRSVSGSRRRAQGNNNTKVAAG